MIYTANAFAISTLLAAANFPRLDLSLVSTLAPVYADGLSGLALLLLRVSVGGLFILHGYPKLVHLRRWAESLKMPVVMCFLSAASMVGGGVCLIAGFLTLLATVPIFCSMLFAAYLDITKGQPLVAQDPYLIPEGQYRGPDGIGEPPSWEKALIYCIILIAIAVIGPGAYSVDASIFGK
jgi:putative oxidoreductase